MYLFTIVGLAAACYFLNKAWQQPRPGVILAAILWLLYAVHEFLIGYGVLCDAKCNIRVDLIVIWPLLAIATLHACNTQAQRSVVKRVLAVIAFVVFMLLASPLVYIALVGFPEETQADRNSQPSPK